VDLVAGRSIDHREADLVDDPAAPADRRVAGVLLNIEHGVLEKQCG